MCQDRMCCMFCIPAYLLACLSLFVFQKENSFTFFWLPNSFSLSLKYSNITEEYSSRKKKATIPKSPVSQITTLPDTAKHLNECVIFQNWVIYCHITDIFLNNILWTSFHISKCGSISSYLFGYIILHVVFSISFVIYYTALAPIANISSAILHLFGGPSSKHGTVLN